MLEGRDRERALDIIDRPGGAAGILAALEEEFVLVRPITAHHSKTCHHTCGLFFQTRDGVARCASRLCVDSGFYIGFSPRPKPGPKCPAHKAGRRRIGQH